MAAVDTVRFRREIAGHKIRFQAEPARLITDPDGAPLGIEPPKYEQTAFLVDALGRLDGEWIGERP